MSYILNGFVDEIVKLAAPPPLVKAEAPKPKPVKAVAPKAPGFMERVRSGISEASGAAKKKMKQLEERRKRELPIYERGMKEGRRQAAKEQSGRGALRRMAEGAYDVGSGAVETAGDVAKTVGKGVAGAGHLAGSGITGAAELVGKSDVAKGALGLGALGLLARRALLKR